jgi:hypothetical protein
MSDQSSDLDLKFLPDWLKESPVENRYANFQGEAPDRRGDRNRGSGGGKPFGAPRGDRPNRGGPPQRSGGGDRRDAQRAPRREGAPRGGDRRPEQRPPAPLPPQAPSVRVEFLPEANGMAGIAKQIRSGSRAYPLFGTARMFLERPERHRVRITSLDANKPLFQMGDGPVSFDRTGLERNAFQLLKGEYYKEEILEGEPIKGNFSNVARSRSTGAFLGPTNHHGYQPALRKLYEERFSRRMSFSEFQHEEIVIVNDAQIISDWKEQARSSTTFTTLKEAEPIIFKSLSEAEQHFRKTYLLQLIKSAVSLETSGEASRACTDRGILTGLRASWEQERGFPGSLVHHLRPRFTDVGLHFFKHRKRIIYISPIRPQRHSPTQLFSEGIASILSIVEVQPKITRPQLAVKLLGEQYDTPEFLPKKAGLASDLHYLIHAGHVIEFHDGTLDLPLSPRAENEALEKPKPSSNKPAKAALVSAVEELTGELAEESLEMEESLMSQSEPVVIEAEINAPTAVESPEPSDPPN